jgi:hypothetical protein
MMYGDDDFDNSAIDLNRVRKLAGLPDNTAGEMPASTFEPEGSFDLDDDLDPEDVDGSADMGSPSAAIAPMDGEGDMGGMDDMGLEDIGLGDAALGAPVIGGSEQSDWTAMLNDLEKQLPDIPVGDFRDVIDSLRRLANYAEDIRRTLVTENRRSLKDYVTEALAGVPTVPTVPTAPTAPLAAKAPIKPGSTAQGQEQTIGQNRQEAVKALATRMGGKPQDTAAATKMLANMQRNGMVKTKGSAFTMQPMDDDQFNSAVNDPMLKR